MGRDSVTGRGGGGERFQSRLEAVADDAGGARRVLAQDERRADHVVYFVSSGPWYWVMSTSRGPAKKKVHPSGYAQASVALPWMNVQ